MRMAPEEEKMTRRSPLDFPIVCPPFSLCCLLIFRFFLNIYEILSFYDVVYKRNLRSWEVVVQLPL